MNIIQSSNGYNEIVTSSVSLHYTISEQGSFKIHDRVWSHIHQLRWFSWCSHSKLRCPRFVRPREGIFQQYSFDKGRTNFSLSQQINKFSCSWFNHWNSVSPFNPLLYHQHWTQLQKERPLKLLVGAKYT